MNSLERLRLATALVHTVPGAELRLDTFGGETIVVSAHPAADISACALRRVAIAAACPNVIDPSDKIARIHVGGSLQDFGGGVYRVVRGGTEQRWAATTLAPDAVADLLDLVGVDSIPADAMHGCLKPDADLGVTLLVITSNDRRYDHALDDVAAQAVASIFTEELLSGSLHASHGAQRAQGAS